MLLTDMNIDCLEAVLEHLTLANLLKAADVNRRLRRVAQQVFDQKYGRKKINFTWIGLCPQEIRWMGKHSRIDILDTSVSIRHHQTISKLMRNFDGDVKLAIDYISIISTKDSMYVFERNFPALRRLNLDIFLYSYPCDKYKMINRFFDPVRGMLCCNPQLTYLRVHSEIFKRLPPIYVQALNRSLINLKSLHFVQTKVIHENTLHFANVTEFTIDMMNRINSHPIQFNFDQLISFTLKACEMNNWIYIFIGQNRTIKELNIVQGMVKTKFKRTVPLLKRLLPSLSVVSITRRKISANIAIEIIRNFELLRKLTLKCEVSSKKIYKKLYKKFSPGWMVSITQSLKEDPDIDTPIEYVIILERSQALE